MAAPPRTHFKAPEVRWEVAGIEPVWGEVFRWMKKDQEEG